MLHVNRGMVSKRSGELASHVSPKAVKEVIRPPGQLEFVDAS